MPSPCSLRFGIVRGLHEAAVEALHPSRLVLAAGESMKIAGASRRSAAPGSQNVGVAEYGDDVRTQPYAAMEPTAIGNDRGARLKPWHASVLPPKARGCPAGSFVPLPSSFRSPEPVARSARTRQSAAFPLPGLPGCSLRYPSSQLAAASGCAIVTPTPRVTFPSAVCQQSKERRLTLRST
jgi:hypothetical protein